MERECVRPCSRAREPILRQQVAGIGIPRPKSGRAPFIGLGVRQTWAVLNHLEVGWELKARRVSAYEKERYFPLLMEMRETIEEREYLLALALSLGGVF